MRPHLVRWHQQYAKQGFVVLEIDNGRFETLDTMRQSADKQPLEYSVLWDRDGRNHGAYGVKVWPVAYLIGRDGKVVWEGNPLWTLDRPRPGSPSAVRLIERELQRLGPDSTDRSEASQAKANPCKATTTPAPKP